jgi:hypothetical protein
METSLSSCKRLVGWLFSQSYNSFKEIFDTTKTKPFSNKFLNQLSWDKFIAATIKQVGKGQPANITTLKDGYLASKRRLNNGLKDGSSILYRLQEEYRISLDFLNKMKNSLQLVGEWDTTPDLVEANLDYFFQIPIRNFTLFLAMNVNKFLALFEWIKSFTSDGRIDYKYCKVMTMALQAVPFSFDTGKIQNRTEIWKCGFQRKGNGPLYLSMGVERIIKRSGYGFIRPRIDWETIQFREEVKEKIAFNESILHEYYRRNWYSIRDTKDDIACIEIAGKWLRAYHYSKPLEEFIIGFFTIHLIKLYRKYIFQQLKFPVKEEYKEQAQRGEIYLY